MKINKETGWIVYKNGDIFSPDTEWKHPSGNGICKKKGRKLKFGDNGTGYMITNRKGKVYLLHRIVYCTYNNLPLDGKFDIGHYNDTGSDNRLSNLYLIVGHDRKQQNTDHRKKSYMLGELYKRNNMFKKLCDYFINK